MLPSDDPEFRNASGSSHPEGMFYLLHLPWLPFHLFIYFYFFLLYLCQSWKNIFKIRQKYIFQVKKKLNFGGLICNSQKLK